MKHIMYLLICGCIFGCAKSEPYCYLKEVSLKNHLYVMKYGSNTGGVLHSPNCPCLQD